MMANYSSSYRLKGILLGICIVFFAATLISIEIGRIFSGSITHGQNISNQSQYLIYPSNVVGFNGNQQNPMIENRWIWPWSTATLLFGLVFFLTGVTGIASGQTQSYSGILTFFICLIVSTSFDVFLIATYATIIAGWKSIYNNELPQYAKIDWSFSIACLAICCLLLILFLISLYISGIIINICTRKPPTIASVPYGFVPLQGTPMLVPTRRVGPPGTPLIRKTPMVQRR